MTDLQTVARDACKNLTTEVESLAKERDVLASVNNATKDLMCVVSSLKLGGSWSDGTREAVRTIQGELDRKLSDTRLVSTHVQKRKRALQARCDQLSLVANQLLGCKNSAERVLQGSDREKDALGESVKAIMLGAYAPFTPPDKEER